MKIGTTNTRRTDHFEQTRSVNRRNLTNLSLASIDYMKTYDVVPYSWIIECLEIFQGSQNIITLIRNSMNNWRVELTSMGEKLGEVNITRGIF